MLPNQGSSNASQSKIKITRIPDNEVPEIIQPQIGRSAIIITPIQDPQPNDLPILAQPEPKEPEWPQIPETEEEFKAWEQSAKARQIDEQKSGIETPEGRNDKIIKKMIAINKMAAKESEETGKAFNDIVKRHMRHVEKPIAEPRVIKKPKVLVAVQDWEAMYHQVKNESDMKDQIIIALTNQNTTLQQQVDVQNKKLVQQQAYMKGTVNMLTKYKNNVAKMQKFAVTAMQIGSYFDNYSTMLTNDTTSGIQALSKCLPPPQPGLVPYPRPPQQQAPQQQAPQQPVQPPPQQAQPKKQ